MIFEESYTLHNGAAIPKLALGTWFIDDDRAAEAVRAAVNIGYRHIDTAQAYGNERGVGEGIRTCGIDRKDIFVTSKVAAENKSYASAMESIEKTLETMGLDYLDMMIIHSPQPWVEVNQSEDRYYKENREVWRALEDALEAGKLRAIGVSNFLEGDLENIFAGCRVKPMVNQILCHVGNSPLALIDYCRKRDIVVEAYSPVAHGEALKDGCLAEMAEKYGVTIPQLCIRYDWQLGTVVLPKTAERERTAEKRWGMETDPPLSAGIVIDEQTESVRRHKSIFSQIGQGSLPWSWSWDSSFAMKKKDRAKVRTKAALMKSAVSFLRYAMIPPFSNRNNNRNKKAHVLKAVRTVP